MKPFGSRQFREWLFAGIPVGRLFGITISLHPVLVLFLLIDFLRVLAQARGAVGGVGLTGFSIGLFLFFASSAVVLGSVLLHELGHCYGAHLVGGGADHILLWPLGGLAFTEGAQRSPWHELVVVACGPLASLLLYIVARLALWIMPVPPVDWTWAALCRHAVWMFSDLNLALFLFNVFTPLFPMDSARLLRAGFSTRHEAGKVTHNICLLGFVVAGMLIIIGVMDIGGGWVSRHSYFMFLIAAMGIMACLNEMTRIQYEHVYTNPHAGPEALWLLRAKLRGWMKGGRGRSGMAGGRDTGRIRVGRTARIVDMFSDRERLERELNDAIEREDFARAAELRDKLLRINGAGGKT